MTEPADPRAVHPSLKGRRVLVTGGGSGIDVAAAQATIARLIKGGGVDAGWR